VDGAAGIDGDASPAALVLGVVVVEDELEDDELEHAVAITAIGIRAAAVQAKRILLATGGNSFTRCTHGACACQLARWCVRAKDRVATRAGGMQDFGAVLAEPG
jgi:hypothetical protein